MLVFLGVGFILAAWAFSYNNLVQGTVLQGGGVLLVIEDIANFSVNAINESVNNTQNLSLYNKNGDKIVTLNLTINKTLTELSCTDYLNDCSIGFWNLTSEVNSGDPIELVSGFNNFTLETSCVQFSCGQNITIGVGLE